MTVTQVLTIGCHDESCPAQNAVDTELSTLFQPVNFFQNTSVSLYCSCSLLTTQSWFSTGTSRQSIYSYYMHQCRTKRPIFQFETWSMYLLTVHELDQHTGGQHLSLSLAHGGRGTENNVTPSVEVWDGLPVYVYPAPPLLSQQV